MLPSGAAAGPSVRPPLIFAVRVKSSSSFAPGGTTASPVGAGASAAARRNEERPTASRDAKTVRMRTSRWENSREDAAYRRGSDFSSRKAAAMEKNGARSPGDAARETINKNGGSR